jgi:hypothetical protein
MKKFNAVVLAMGLLLAFLTYAALEVRVTAQITCQSLSGCCGAAGCSGPGTPTGCTIACQGGGSAICCSNASGTCQCDGSGGAAPKPTPPRPY